MVPVTLFRSDGQLGVLPSDELEDFPLCTPAHGTAYDIAGKGIADVGASREAVLLAARMARRSAGLSVAA
jgi:isocitrate/isopropylmalate dehydrogenase